MKLKLSLLILTSAFLLSVPYIIPHTGIVALIALIPLFTAEYLATENKVKNFWALYYAGFLIWNIITTYWIWYATHGGAIAAIVLNALQMAIIFRIFRWFRTIYNNIIPYLAFMVMWICWEHFYVTWQVSWPWLNLGNGFATNVSLIQWYSVLGSSGGSLWVILSNILIFYTLVSITSFRRGYVKYLILSLVVIVLPIIISLRMYQVNQKIDSNLERREVAILQPNIDPYNTKFNTSQDEQNEILFSLAKKAVTPKSFLVLAPETFFNPSKSSGSFYENMPLRNKTSQEFLNFSRENNVNFIYGAVTQKTTMSRIRPNPYASYISPSVWLNSYNSAVFNNSEGEISIYHKSKLVILAESVPIINDKPVFESFGIDLGGGIGNFTPQSYRTLFKTKEGVIIGTAICYESVFGEFCREYINNGANLLTVITNDGWWRNTPGHIQHLNYARLRAIETRRYIARSANTGISAIINSCGDIVEQTPWWEECYINGEVGINNKITPFVKWGDLTGLASSWISLILLILAFSKRILRRSSIS